MPSVPALLAILLLLGQPLRGETAPSDEDWLQLFNGGDLSGRTPKISKHPL